MSSHLVDGVPLPDPVGGHAALDFCNTRAGWGSPQPKEYLTHAAVLALWCQDAGLLPPATVRLLRARLAGAPDPAADLLQQALALREAVYAVALGRREGSGWALVAEQARRARAAEVLVPITASGPTTGGPARWVLGTTSIASGNSPEDEPDLELPLLAVARAAGDLLTDSAGALVSACPGIGCGWLFSNPHRRRRWCSMAVCGNRAKVRRHAQRRTATHP